MVVVMVMVGFVMVRGTVPEKTVTGDGVTVLVWIISMVFVSKTVWVGARTVWTAAFETVWVIVVVRGPSGPSRLTNCARRASLSAISIPGERRILAAAVVLAVAEDVAPVDLVDEVANLVIGFEVSAAALGVFVQRGVIVDEEVMVIAEWVLIVFVFTKVEVEVVLLWQIVSYSEVVHFRED
jgi:hypothetical protein